MKKSLLLWFLSHLYLFSQTGWFWQNPLPQGNALTGVKFVSPETGWAVGSDGTILKSTDGGISWIFQPSASTQFFTAVDFTDENYGTVVGWKGYILRTTDGGTSWSLQHSGTSKSLYSVDFYSRLIGFAVGESGMILKTTNGGANWSFLFSGVAEDLFDVCFIDLNTVVIISHEGTFIKTTDGGTSWSIKPFGQAYSLWSLSFINAANGIICGHYFNGNNNEGIILKTTDGGVNWSYYYTGITDKLLYTASFYNQNNAQVAGGSGNIIMTINGGETWQHHQTGVEKNFRSIACIDSGTILLVGHKGVIMKTTDAGNSWVSHQHGTLAHLWGVHFTDINYGTAVGGAILRTSNGGTSWFEQQSLPDDKWLNDVFFTDQNKGTGVGSSGIIIRTTNGTDWSFQQSGTSTDLYGISFTDEFNAIAGGSDPYGENGVILRTTNGGQTWVTELTGISGIFSVCMINRMTAFAAAANGKIYKTSNGGKNWFSQVSGTTKYLWDIFFTDTDYGYTVGGDGYGYVILKTTNGGLNWEIQGTGTTDRLLAVSFIDRNNGYAVGGKGQILKTTDGGTNWIIQQTRTNNQLSSVWCTDANTATAVGSYGLILRTISGGIIPVERVSFTAHVEEEGVKLKWTTASETNNSGFDIERKTEYDWEKIAFLKGQGSKTESSEYTYFDDLKDKNTSRMISYRLKQIDYDGTFSYSDVVEIIINNVPDRFYLYECYPNPFNPLTRIKFSIPVRQVVELKIYDVLGVQVAEIIHQELSPGIYEREWDGSNSSSGTYFFRLTAGDFTETRKMMLVK